MSVLASVLGAYKYSMWLRSRGAGSASNPPYDDPISIPTSMSISIYLCVYLDLYLISVSATYVSVCLYIPIPERTL